MKKNQITENWVPAVYIREDGTILDFTGLYEVSSLGRVRSLNYRHTGKTKVLKQHIQEGEDGNMFYKVALSKDGRTIHLITHRLILSSFKPNDYFLNAFVDHIVCRTSVCCDNRLTNLRWVTKQQNSSTSHCIEQTSKALTNRKDLSKAVKVTDLTTREVTIYPSAREVDRTLGLPLSTVTNRIHNQNGYYKKLNLHFAYV